MPVQSAKKSSASPATYESEAHLSQGIIVYVLLGFCYAEVAQGDKGISILLRTVPGISPSHV